MTENWKFELSIDVNYSPILLSFSELSPFTRDTLLRDTYEHSFLPICMSSLRYYYANTSYITVYQ